MKELLYGYPADSEVPTPESPVPACMVAVSRLGLEDATSAEPWPDPPLLSAERVVCIEDPDPANIERVSATCQEAGAGTGGEVAMLRLGVRDRVYTSASIAAVAYDLAVGRQPRSDHSEVLLWPFKRTPAWWSLDELQRQALFLPRLDDKGEVVVPGHIKVSEQLVPIVHRRLYHEPQFGGMPGYTLGWFETSPNHLTTLKEIVTRLQDVTQVPDHAFYQCGALWWGRRVPVEDVLIELTC